MKMSDKEREFLERFAKNKEEDSVIHINATPEFFKNKKAVKAMKKMIKLAFKSK